MIDVSVVVPVGSGTTYLDEQLSALAAQATDLSYEVIIVDNVSRPRPLAGHDGRFRTVHARALFTPGYARNVGAKAANAEVILFCDADDIVSHTWLHSLAQGAAVADLFGGPIDEERLDPVPPGARTRAWVALPRDLDAMPWFIGANLGIRATALRAIGGWEERWHAAEEIDLCWRAQLAGLTLAEVPDAVVFYRPRPTPATAFTQGWTWGFATPRLWRRFRRYGFRRPSLARVIRDWSLLALFTPLALASSGFRRDWARLLGVRAGRLAGSLRWRQALL